MNKTLKKALFLGALFLVVVLAAFLILGLGGKEEHNSSEEGNEETAGRVGTPEVSFLYADLPVNALVGYKDEPRIDETLFQVLPVGEDGKVQIRVNTQEELLPELRYSVCSADRERTIEEGSAALTQQQEGYRAELTLSDALTRSEPLDLYLELSPSEDVTYFYGCRVCVDQAQNEMTAQLLDYALTFHEKTLDKESGESLKTVLESRTLADRSDLAHVDIYSALETVLYEELEVQPRGELTADLMGCDGESMALRLNFMLSALGDDTVTHYYEVSEYFYLRHVESLDATYVLTYDRKMEEIFEPSEKTVTSGRVSLGICSGDLLWDADAQGRYTVFQANGTLWLYCADSHEINALYTLYPSSGARVSASKGRAAFRILDIDDEGNVSFLTYGYGCSAFHPAESGISCYRYERAEHRVSEVFYYASALPFSDLAEDVKTLSCIGETDMLYLKLSDTVYAVDMLGRDCVVVMDGAEGKYLVSNTQGNVIAWQEKSAGGGTRISRMDLTGGNALEINDDGEIVPLAFSENDLIYGRPAEEAADNGLVPLTLYSSLAITDEQGEVRSTYSREGYLIGGVEVENNRIRIQLMEQQEGGCFPCGEDLLIQNETTESRAGKVTLSSRMQDKFLRNWYLSVPALKNQDKLLSVSHPVEEAVAGSYPTIEQNRDTLSVNPYKYYLNGVCAGSTDEAGAAINLASSEKGGFVLDANRRKIYQRAAYEKSGGFPVTLAAGTDELARVVQTVCYLQGISYDPAEELAKGRTAQDILTSLLGERLINATGCSSETLIFFLQRKCWVISWMPGVGYTMLTGYDSGRLFYLAPSGAELGIDRKDAEKLFEEAGNIFLTVMPVNGF